MNVRRIGTGLMSSVAAVAFGFTSAQAMELPPIVMPDEPVIVADDTYAPPEIGDGLGAPGSNWMLTGAVTGSARLYTDSDLLPGFIYDLTPLISNDDVYPAISGWAKAVYTSDDERHRVTAEVYGRYDINNREGTVDLPLANYFYDGGFWSFLAGANKVFWGVTESRHLVDIINQRDLDGNPSRERRLGQPMINVNHVGDYGTLSLYGLFGFREQNFDLALDRIDLGFFINEDEAEFEDGDWRHLAFAARYSNTVSVGNDSLDYAISLFTGTARDPRFEVDFDLGEFPPIFLKPIYDHIDQVGIETLYVHDNLQLKFEGIVRHQQSETDFAAVAGFEYTLPRMDGSNLDIGLVGEYLYDSRGNEFGTTYLFSDNDIFTGVRLGFNNDRNTSVLAGMVFELEDNARYVTVEASSLINDSTQISLEGRFYDNIPLTNPLFPINHEDFLELSITKFF